MARAKRSPPGRKSPGAQSALGVLAVPSDDAGGFAVPDIKRVGVPTSNEEITGGGFMLPGWLVAGLEEMSLGVSEVKGPQHNKRILEYHATTTLSATSDEIPWCSSFVNWCVERAGFAGTGSAMALSWATWGVPVDGPEVGAIAVMRRGSIKSGKGHVFMVTSWDDQYVYGVGGNQRDAVAIHRFPRSRIIAYRKPKRLWDSTELKANALASTGSAIQVVDHIFSLPEIAQLIGFTARMPIYLSLVVWGVVFTSLAYMAFRRVHRLFSAGT